MDWIDVSIPLREEMTVFTGEPPFRRERISAIADGAVCNISQMALGVHTGTHVDAPVHFVEGGETAEAIALDALIGPAWVVDATAATGSITAADLDRFDIPADEVRLLFRTRTAHLWDSPGFEPGFVALDATAAAALVRRGVRSVGIDYLSIAPFGDPVAHAPDPVRGGRRRARGAGPAERRAGGVRPAVPATPDRRQRRRAGARAPPATCLSGSNRERSDPPGVRDHRAVSGSPVSIKVLRPDTMYTMPPANASALFEPGTRALVTVSFEPPSSAGSTSQVIRTGPSASAPDPNADGTT